MTRAPSVRLVHRTRPQHLARHVVAVVAVEIDSMVVEGVVVRRDETTGALRIAWPSWPVLGEEGVGAFGVSARPFASLAAAVEAELLRQFSASAKGAPAADAAQSTTLRTSANAPHPILDRRIAE
jgi:hypothetical protein